MIEKEEIIEENTEEVDLFDSWRSLEFNIDEDYDYVPNNLSFRLLSDTLYFLIAYPILKILTKIIYDLKIEGEENIRYFENGAVTISNHVLVLDCAMIGLACGFRKEHFTTLAKSFKIPVVRRLIKLLKAIPIPEEISNKKNFFRAIDKLLQEGEIVHFYPEASLIPYCKNIRKFKNGAFEFSIRNNVPIVPMVIKFRKPEGLRRIFKNKPDVTLKVLKPMYAEGMQVDEFRDKVYETMNNE